MRRETQAIPYKLEFGLFINTSLFITSKAQSILRTAALVYMVLCFSYWTLYFTCLCLYIFFNSVESLPHTALHTRNNENCYYSSVYGGLIAAMEVTYRSAPEQQNMMTIKKTQSTWRVYPRSSSVRGYV